MPRRSGGAKDRREGRSVKTLALAQAWPFEIAVAGACVVSSKDVHADTHIDFHPSSDRLRRVRAASRRIA